MKANENWHWIGFSKDLIRNRKTFLLLLFFRCINKKTICFVGPLVRCTFRMKLTGSNNIYHIPYRKYLNLVEECIKFLKTTIELVHESKNLTQLKHINIYIRTNFYTYYFILWNSTCTHTCTFGSLDSQVGKISGQVGKISDQFPRKYGVRNEF